MILIILKNLSKKNPLCTQAVIIMSNKQIMDTTSFFVDLVIFNITVIALLLFINCHKSQSIINKFAIKSLLVVIK